MLQLEQLSKLDHRQFKALGQSLQALSGLAPYLDEALKEQVLQEALEVARAIEDERARAKVLSKLASHLVNLPFTTLYTLWCETLLILATRRRSDLLADIGALSPVIVKLGGDKVIREIARGILDVGRWWP